MAWTRGPTLGRGSSAVVSLATAPGGEYFAVKSTDLSSSTFLRKEENLISRLHSPYVVRCFGSDVTRENDARLFNLFLEYVPGGTLSDQVRIHGGALGEAAIRSHARRILLGLSYLHGQGMAHCDIKGQNILVGDEGSKIADFGCAKLVGSGEPAAFSGTPAYMAPEVARGEEQSFPADVWALGCTIVEMATGSAPWSEMRDPASALYRIGFSEDVPEFPGWLSGAAKEVLARCLTRDPRERWTASQLLEHPFFAEYAEEEEEEEEECAVDCGGNVMGEFTRKSPTSVMDQGFWDALESSNCSRNPTEIASTPDDRPSGRVEDLFGASVGLPGWEDGENWLTVRGDEIEELVDGESATFISVEDEEIIRDSVVVSMVNYLDGDGDDSNSALLIRVAAIDECCVIGMNVDHHESENYNVNGIVCSSMSTFFCLCFCLFFVNATTCTTSSILY